MSLKGKNRAVFSYNNIDKSNSNFMYKNFDKSNSYASRFCKCNFNYTSLRGAKFKYCNFNSATFIGTEFVGTNLRGSLFKNATFEDTIFNSANLDKTNFDGATFKNVYFLCTNVENIKHYKNIINNAQVTIMNKMPKDEEFSDELLKVVKGLREHDIIRRSHVLHLKNKRINTLSLYILKLYFTEEELIKYIPIFAKQVTNQFYTLSYLKKYLLKIQKDDII